MNKLLEKVFDYLIEENQKLKDKIDYLENTIKILEQKDKINIPQDPIGPISWKYIIGDPLDIPPTYDYSKTNFLH